MNSKILKYLLCFFVVATIVSCYEDKSKIDSNKFTPVKIDVTDIATTLRVGYLEELNLTPKVYKDGVQNHKDLVCTWYVSEIANKPEFIKLQDGVELKSVIDRGIDNNAYLLKLEVLDKEYDFPYNVYFSLYVSSSFGEGLVVSYTEDNKKSDIALIMDAPISQYYNKPLSIRKGLYNVINEEPIDGLIKNVCFSYQYNRYRSSLWITKQDGSILSLNCKDYKDDKMEMVFTPDGFMGDRFVDSNQSIMLCSSEGIYRMGPNDSKPSMPFTKAINGGDPTKGIVSTDPHDQGTNSNLVWYSPSKGSFYAIGSQFASSTFKFPDNDTRAFNAGNLPNQECLAAGVSSDKQLHTFLLKDKSSGNYAIYTIERSYTDWNNYENSHDDRAKAKFDIPVEANSIIASAKSIFFMFDFPVMYVTTETGVYTINFSVSPALYSSTPKYSAPSGEKITFAKLYQDGMYTTRSDMYEYGAIKESELNNRAIIIATQKSEFEGNVYVVPMVKNLASTGVLDTDPSKTLKYSGFAKILDITTQGLYSE